MDFIAAWNRFADFTFPDPEPNYCPYAKVFTRWADELCTAEAQNPTVVSVHQRMLLLLKKWDEWRGAVPQPHRNRIGSRSHVCIGDVFVQAYERLKVIELALTPPLLFLPSPPEAQIAGIFLGTREEQPEDRHEQTKDKKEPHATRTVRQTPGD